MRLYTIATSERGKPATKSGNEWIAGKVTGNRTTTLLEYHIAPAANAGEYRISVRVHGERVQEVLIQVPRPVKRDQYLNTETGEVEYDEDR